LAVEFIARAIADLEVDRLPEIIVLIVLSNFANKEGKAWPGIEKLARLSRLSVRETQRAIRSLSKRGKIRVEFGAGPCGVNIYWVGGGVPQSPPVPQSPRPTVTRGGDNHGPSLSPNPSGTVSGTVNLIIGGPQGNHPALAIVIAYVLEHINPHMKEGYSETEIRQVWLDFESAKDSEDNWYHWGGKRKIGDWRAGIEQQLGFNRQQQKAKSNGTHQQNSPNGHSARNRGKYLQGRGALYEQHQLRQKSKIPDPPRPDP